MGTNTDEKQARADGVSRQLTGEEAPEDTTQPVGPTGGVEGQMAPEGVGESIAHRGENMIEEEGKEPGRYDTGVHEKTGRPYGKSTARDATGVDPQEPVTEGAPTLTGMGSAS
jgi:hypothetical protein